MKFKYLGDKQDMAVFGYDFSNGKTPEVTDAFAIGKLTNNMEFETVVAPVPVQAALPTEEPAVTDEDQDDHNRGRKKKP